MNVKTFSPLVLSAFLMLGIAACEKKGPMEKAGEKIDNAADDAGDALEKAGDKIENKVNH